MSDLLKKLQSIGLKIEKGSNIISEPGKGLSIDRVIKGEWIESRGEKVFVVKESYPFGSAHGNVVFEKDLLFGSIAQFWGIDQLETMNLNDFLFLDTETSGLSLGAGTIIFLFGCCFFSENGLEVIQFFLEDPASELTFLANVDESIQSHKCLVSYNGKSFDLPMLRTRMILNRLPYNSLAKPHLDLLHFARSLWKLRLESRKLSDIEKDILAFHRSKDEVPGWLVPQLYQDYLSTGNASPLEGVFYHNRNDVVSLAALFSHITRLVSEKSALESANFLDIISIGSIYQKSGNFSLSEGFYQHGLNRTDPSNLDNRVLRDFAQLMKRQNKWIEAVELWKVAAKKDDPISCIELAKYFEHREINLFSASNWVETAISIATRTDGTEKIMTELNHRKTRLEIKIQSSYEKR